MLFFSFFHFLFVISCQSRKFPLKISLYILTALFYISPGAMQQARMRLVWSRFFMLTHKTQLQKAFPFGQHPHRLSPFNGIILKCIQWAFFDTCTIYRIGFKPLNLMPLFSLIRIVDVSVHVGVLHFNNRLVHNLEPIHVDDLAFMESRPRCHGGDLSFHSLTQSFWLQINFKYLYLSNICWWQTLDYGAWLLMINDLKLGKDFSLWFALLFFLEMVWNYVQLINCILMR